MQQDRYSVTGNIACYRDWFTEAHRELQVRVLLGAIFEPAPWVTTVNAHALLVSLGDRAPHEIALWMENALSAKFSTSERHVAGDPDRWLEIRNHPDVVNAKPASQPTEQDCLAVMWMWKATAMQSVMDGYGGTLISLAADEPAEVRAQLLASIELGRRQDLRLLTYEATRAGCLIDDRGVQLAIDEAIKSGRKAIAKKGGIARSEQFAEVRRRVIDLYAQTPRRSREATAEDIWKILNEEGFTIALRTVRDYLKEHDDHIEARRGTRS